MRSGTKQHRRRAVIALISGLDSSAGTTFTATALPSSVPPQTYVCTGKVKIDAAADVVGLS